MALSDGSYYTTGWHELDRGRDHSRPEVPSVRSCATATYCMVTDGSDIFG